MYTTEKNNSRNTRNNKDSRFIVFAIVLGFVITCIMVQPTPYAYGVNAFLQMPIRVQHSPTICALEPQAEENFPKVGSKVLDLTEYAVLDWKTKLNENAGKHPVWNINLIKIPLGQQNGFDYTKCDITIHFLPRPQTRDEEFVALGITIPNFETGKTNIEIYYLDFQPNWKMVTWWEGNIEYYTYVDEPYYTGNLATDTQLAITIRHEIGHSFGLGHYVVSYERRENIVKGMEDMPSIMIDTATILGVTHYDITSFDTGEIKSIYGQGGFDTVSNEPKRAHLLDTSKPIYLTDDRIKLSIDTSQFTNDTQGGLLIVDSNNTLANYLSISKSNSTIYLGSKYNDEKGKYWIEFINPITNEYDYTSFISGTQQTTGTMIQQPATPKVTQGPEDTNIATQTTIQIPSWIKNNAKWWSSDQLGDAEFIQGIQYLIDKGVMVVPKSQPSTSSSDQIPKWIKSNAGWWADDKITDDEFVKGIEYLVSSGIIKLNG